MALSVVSQGSESMSPVGVSLSFEPRPRLVSSDQPFPDFSVRRYAELAAEHATAEQMEDGRYFVESGDLNGVWGDGNSEEEARREFVDAVIGWASVKMD